MLQSQGSFGYSSANHSQYSDYFITYCVEDFSGIFLREKNRPFIFRLDLILLNYLEDFKTN
jgi:hypothetical protein